MTRFDELLAEGTAADVSTWGAGFLLGRHGVDPPPWTYRDLVEPYLGDADTLLDMGTGDGSRLLGLAPLPPHTVAYEDWAPTVPAARAALVPAGVALVQCRGSADNNDPQAAHREHPPLPFRDGVFDTVVNRHTCFDPVDVHRVLRPGGVFVTQQVGGSTQNDLRALLGHPPADTLPWDLVQARAQVEHAGLTVIDSGEAVRRMWWTDVGALVAYLRSVPWEVPEFDVTRHRDRLRELHSSGVQETGFGVFWLAAQRPAWPG